MTSFRLRVMAQVLPFLLVAPVVAPTLVLAQTAPTRGEATAATKPAAGQNQAAAQYTRQQIDQMLAPVALYPDPLLAQVLMASTYPQQLVDAKQWLDDSSNAALKDEALLAALQPLPWDASVKSLVAFPQVIVMMTEHIDWTQTLGVAFATQQPQVMERIQALRQLAVKSGRLNKVRHVKVQQKGRVIVIEPAEPDRVFVPVYNPTVVYGAWPERNFPPVFLPPPRGFVAETIEPGIEVSVAYHVPRPLWVWSVPDWESRRITVNTVEYTRISREVRVAPGNTWRREGPVVLVRPPAPRPGAVAVSVPAGTVAPVAAAAVVALPQRAARQPDAIRVATPGGQPAAPTAAQPGTPPTPPATTAQPGTAQPGTTPPTPPATTAQPGGTQPGTTPPTPPATTAQPSGTQPGTTPGTTAQPTQPRPGQPATAQPGADRPAPPPRQPSADQREPGQPGATERARERAEPGRPETVRPGQTQATTPSDRPAGAQPDRQRPSAAGEQQPAARPGATTQPGRDQPRAAEPGARPAREPEGARPSAGTPDRTPDRATRAPDQPTRTPDQAGTRPSGAPPAAAPGQRPEAAGAPPGERPAARPPASAQRPAAPEAGAQGTTAPPQRGPSAAPQQRGPEPGAAPQQRPQEPAGARQEGGGDRGDKKDRQ